MSLFTLMEDKTLVRERFVAIGDSITYGYPYTKDKSWVAVAADKLGVEIINKGVCGDTILAMMVRFKADVLIIKPEYVIILGGTNDACCQNDVKQAFENLKYMVQVSLYHSIKPIIGIPIPVNDESMENWLQQYRYYLNDYSCKNNIQIINFFEALYDKNTKKLIEGVHIDGIHPNITGYQLMAKKFIQDGKKFMNTCRNNK